MLFYENYVVYYNVYCYFCGVFIEKNEYTKFHLDWLLSYMAIYVPIVMSGLRLFIVVLQELQCLPNCLHVSIIIVSITSPSFVCLHLQVFEIR